jgi:Protein of unknown function (DUF3551)
VRCVSILDRAVQRIALLFFLHDGAAVAPIPCQPAGLKAQQTKENTMQQLFKLSAAPMAGLFAMALAAVATPASAGPNEYCRQDVSSAMRSCSFATMEQCQAMSSGRGGTCYRDPFLPPVSTTSAYAYAPLHGDKRARKPAANH